MVASATGIRIVRLEAQDVLRLTAVDISPEGNLICIGGENGAGKTSVLNCLEMAIGGVDSKAVPMPIRKGAEKGRIVADLGEFIIERTFTAKGSELVVKTREGAKYSSPQKMLDGLFGALSFDPLAFRAMKPADQRDTLRKLVGLDFTKIEADRLAAFNKRTDVNRQVKEIEARLAIAPKHDDAPEKEVLSADLVKELERRQAVNVANEKFRDSYADQVDEATALSEGNGKTGNDEIKSLATLEEELVALRKLADLKEAEILTRQLDIQAAQKESVRLKAEVDKLVDANVDEARTKINTADEQNRKFRENEAHAKQSADLKAKQSEAEQLTADIDACDQEKNRQIVAAEFPLKGLAFTDSGVTFDGIPSEQWSDEQAIRISVSIGLALNPKLRLLLMREGAFVTPKRLKIIAEMAVKANAQVILERVGFGKECQVVISDGHVATAEEIKALRADAESDAEEVAAAK